MQYLISASVSRTVDGWTSTHSLPTFLLDDRVQGIVSADHAERIARRMLVDVSNGADIVVSAHPAD